MNKVIILLGPTGVGKTGASILLAKSLGTEIISSDSMQIYKRMDIGTAKPSKEQMSEVRHHMIDIVEPCVPYSAGRYIEDVTPIIEALHKKGKIPVVTGGTGLYIKAMTRGIFSGPSADWKLREELLALEEEQAGALYAYLKKLDPDAASRILPADTRRVIRALEVCLKTESGISELQRQMTRPLPYEFIKIGLTRNRKELYKIIEERVDGMINAGLVAEVKRLMDLFRHSALSTQHSALSSMQAIGYKETAMFLRGESTFEEAVRLIKRNTKRYAKRQFTWFKKEEDVHWIDITGIYNSEETFKNIHKALEASI